MNSLTVKNFWNYIFAVLAVFASVSAYAEHPGPQLRPEASSQVTSSDGSTTFVETASGFFGLSGSELPYVESDATDSNDEIMVNTLPSRPTKPFNLHAEPVQSFDINRSSPREDLRNILNKVRDDASIGMVNLAQIDRGINIIEGNPVANRAYSGFAMLHYTAGERLKRVVPELDTNGNVIGGNVEVRQVWFDNQIESDTALLDPSAVQNVPWTVTYVIDVLKGGADDFSPFGMFFDAPPAPNSFGDAHIGIDQSFYPLSEGKRYVIKIKYPPAKYYKLTYTWGWRKHPPRIQAMENSLQFANGKSLLEWETDVFGTSPRSNEARKEAAIAKIGDLSPVKRIWRALVNARMSQPQTIITLMDDAKLSFADWSNRTRLPRGVSADTSSDATLFYVNNTIYGNIEKVANWDSAGKNFKVSLKNGDHFPHMYMAVDFGGVRGWENQYQTAGGAAASHTFGRAHWWPLAGPIMVPAVGESGIPSIHKVNLKLNFPPSERLKLYQFDPIHHDVAIYSLH